MFNNQLSRKKEKEPQFAVFVNLSDVNTPTMADFTEYRLGKICVHTLASPKLTATPAFLRPLI